MKKILLSLLVSVMFYATVQAQVQNPVSFEYFIKRQGEDHAELIIKAKIEKGWHLYAQNFQDGGPIRLHFSFSENKYFKIMGEVHQYPDATKEHDDIFDIDIQYFKDYATFIQNIHLKKVDVPLNIKMTFTGQACNSKTGKCVMVTGEHIYN